MSAMGRRPATAKRSSWVESGHRYLPEVQSSLDLMRLIRQCRYVKREAILEVGVGADERLFVRPVETDFAQIFRTASGVTWNEEKRALVGSEPRKWSSSRWFEQILCVAADEYDIALQLTPSTEWSAVDRESQREMESFSKSDWSSELLARQKEADALYWEDFQTKQALSEAGPFWADRRYADYARILAPLRDRLSPAQLKRLTIAEQRSHD